MPTPASRNLRPSPKNKPARRTTQMCWHAHNRTTTNGELETADHTLPTYPKRIPTQTEEFSNQVWNVGTSQKKDAKEEKFCAFHQRKGNLLIVCKAFQNEPLEAKNDCIVKAGLCFRCLSRGHRSTECSSVVKCAKCGDDRHPTTLHKEKAEATRKEHGEEVQTTCTSVCQNLNSSGVSCSKIVLVDVFIENGIQEP